MKATAIVKGGTVTTVTVSHIAEDRPVSDDFIAGFAMHYAGEDPSSTFGYTVRRYPDHEAATVSIFTD